MRAKRDPDMTEAQILQALRDFRSEGKIANEYQLLHYCKKCMYGLWSISKVQKAVKRLEARRKVKTKISQKGSRSCRIVELL